MEAKNTLSAKERKEIKAMDEAIHAAEEKLKAAKARLEDPAIARDFGKLQECQKEVDAEQAKLDALFKGGKSWRPKGIKRKPAKLYSVFVCFLSSGGSISKGWKERDSISSFRRDHSLIVGLRVMICPDRMED